jgi:hypothetical protein
MSMFWTFLYENWRWMQTVHFFQDPAKDSGNDRTTFDRVPGWPQGNMAKRPSCHHDDPQKVSVTWAFCWRKMDLEDPRLRCCFI